MAGVAAARLGARALLIEASGAFGGAATRNMVAQWLGFYNGEECAVRGLPLEFADRVVKRGGSIGFERYVLAEATTNPLPLRRFAFNPEIVKILAVSWWSRAVPRRSSTAAWFRSRSGQIASCRWRSRPKADA